MCGFSPLSLPSPIPYNPNLNSGSLCSSFEPWPSVLQFKKISGRI